MPEDIDALSLEDKREEELDTALDRIRDAASVELANGKQVRLT